MKRILLLLSATAVCALAGCADQRLMGVTERLSASTSEAVMSYSFNSCSATIAPAERERIRAFLTDLGLTRHDTLVVSVPKNRLPRRDPERIKTLDGIFAAFPAQVHYVQDTDLRQLPRSEPTGIIRVVRTTGIAVDCTDGEDAAGCATAHNLAAMIVDPSDTFLPSFGNTYYPPTGGTPVAEPGQ